TAVEVTLMKIRIELCPVWDRAYLVVVPGTATLICFPVKSTERFIVSNRLGGHHSLNAVSSVILREQNIASIGFATWLDDSDVVRVNAAEPTVAVATVCGTEWIYYIDSTHKISQLLVSI